MKHAFKREYVDKALRSALIKLKVRTGVYENYSAMVRSVIKDHPTDIRPQTLRGWLKAWCEKDKEIPRFYSPHEIKKVRKADFPRSPRPEPQFSIFQDEPVQEIKPVTKPPLVLSLGEKSELMIDNGKQIIIVRSVGGYLTIEQA